MLASNKPQVAQLVATINALDAFTLFVPTDDAIAESKQASALLASANDDDDLTEDVSGAKLREFIAQHTCDSLLVPRTLHEQSLDDNATRVVQSLGARPLRIATLAVPIDASAGVARIELLVEGAATLANESYALQEVAQQSSATPTKDFAVVHVINKTLLASECANKCNVTSPATATAAPVPMASTDAHSSQRPTRLQRSRANEPPLAIHNNNKNFYRPSLSPANLELVAHSEPSSPLARNFDERLAVGSESLPVVTDLSHSSTRASDVTTVVPPKRSSLSQVSFGEILLNANMQQPQATNAKQQVADKQSSASPELTQRYQVVLDAVTRQQLKTQATTAGGVTAAAESSTKPEVAGTHANTTHLQHFAYDELMSTSTTTTESSPPLTNSTVDRQTVRKYLPLQEAASAVVTGEQQSQPQSQSQSQFQQHTPAATILSERQMIRFSPQDARDNLSMSLTSSGTGKHKAYSSAGEPCAFYDKSCKRTQKLVRLTTPAPPRRASDNELHATVAWQANRLSATSKTQASPKTSAAAKSASVKMPTTTSTPEPIKGKQLHNQQPRLQNNEPIAILVPIALPIDVDEHELRQHLSQQQPTHFDTSFGEPSGTNNAHVEAGRVQPSAVAQRVVEQSAPNVPWVGGGEKSVRLVTQLPVVGKSQTWRQPREELVRLNVSSALWPPARSLDTGHGYAIGLARISQQQASKAFSAPSDFFRPTPFAVSTLTTHRPDIFAASVKQQQLGPLQTPVEVGKQLHTKQHSAAASSPSSAAHRKLREYIQASGSGATGEPFVPQQQQQLLVTQSSLPPLRLTSNSSSSTLSMSIGDMHITSAATRGLLFAQSSNNLPSAAFGARGLASQSASQVAPEFDSTSSDSNSPKNADFFQNRTIADIMDDSGLRIDGQQVTFSKLKACLRDADLLSLVAHQTGSSMTIFLPTDDAYERLVQQQALQQQAQLATSGGLFVAAEPTHQLLHHQSTRMSRLLAEPANYLLPLVKVRNQMAAGLQQLALDCGASETRRLLLQHMTAKLVTPKLLDKDLSVTNLDSKQLLVSSVPSKKIVVVDGQPVIAATRAKNGMVYVINKFLNVTNQRANVVELVESQPNLSTLAAYLRAANLTDKLRKGKCYTGLYELEP